MNHSREEIKKYNPILTSFIVDKIDILISNHLKHFADYCYELNDKDGPIVFVDIIERSLVATLPFPIGDQLKSYIFDESERRYRNYAEWKKLLLAFYKK